MHRDIKPDNILLGDDYHVTLCDFGFARSTDGDGIDEDNEFSTYVTTRWYRAPEICKRRKYNEVCDVWSIGCVIAEMHLREPLWPAQNDLQLRVLVDQVLVSTSQRVTALAQEWRDRWIRSIKSDANLTSILTVEPMERPTAAEVLQWRKANIPLSESSKCVLHDIACSENALRERIRCLTTPITLARKA